MKIINLKKIDQKLYYYEASNHLKVYLLRNTNVNDYYLTLNVRYGSCDTEFYIDDKYYKVSNGIAHFLEHVNFNIDDNTTAHDLFNKLGSDINAFTTFDFTSYIVNGNNRIKDNIKLLVEYVTKGYFTKDIVEKEKGIIIEEVRMGDNSPNKRFFYDANRGIFNNSKRRNYITGDIDDVKGISVEEVNLVHDAFYNVDNMFLVVTGNFKVKDVIDIVEKLDFKRYGKKVKVKKVEESDKVCEKYKVITNKMVEIPKMKISYKMSNNIYNDYDKEELDLYFKMILQENFGYSSDINEELMEKELISNMSYEYFNEDNIIVCSVFVEAKEPEKVIDIIREKMRNLVITEDVLVRKKRAAIANLINKYDDIEYVNTDIADQLIRYNKIYDNLYDIYSNINSNKVSDIISKMVLDNEAIIIYKGE